MSTGSKVIARTHRQTDTTKTLPLPHTREVIKVSEVGTNKDKGQHLHSYQLTITRCTQWFMSWVSFIFRVFFFRFFHLLQCVR